MKSVDVRSVEVDVVSATASSAPNPDETPLRAQTTFLSSAEAGDARIADDDFALSGDEAENIVAKNVEKNVEANLARVRSPTAVTPSAAAATRDTTRRVGVAGVMEAAQRSSFTLHHKEILDSEGNRVELPHEAEIRAELAKMDKDGDGVLSHREIATFVAEKMQVQRSEVKAVSRVRMLKQVSCAIFVLLLAMLFGNMGLTAAVLALTKEIETTDGTLRDTQGALVSAGVMKEVVSVAANSQTYRALVIDSGVLRTRPEAVSSASTLCCLARSLPPERSPSLQQKAYYVPHSATARSLQRSARPHSAPADLPLPHPPRPPRSPSPHSCQTPLLAKPLYLANPRARRSPCRPLLLLRSRPLGRLAG